MDDPIHDLLAVLSLDEHPNSTFTGPGSGHDEFGLFGGHQLAQAVIAAYRSVDAERRLNSIHAYFLRGGDGKQSVTYEVENIRDGRAFCQRRVNGLQNDKQIFDLTASFHTPESGPGEINPAWPQGVQPPEGLPTFEECMEEVGPIFGQEWSEGARSNTESNMPLGHLTVLRNRGESIFGFAPGNHCPTTPKRTLRSWRT